MNAKLITGLFLLVTTTLPAGAQSFQAGVVDESGFGGSVSVGPSGASVSVSAPRISGWQDVVINTEHVYGNMPDLNYVTDADEIHILNVAAESSLSHARPFFTFPMKISRVLDF